MHQSLFSIFLSLLLSSSPVISHAPNLETHCHDLWFLTVTAAAAAAVTVALPQSLSLLLYRHNLCSSLKSISLFLIAMIIPLTACIGIIILTEVAGFVNL
ncbi:hypothetical protein WN944_009279 [Citrus x changshan-huyou]|uniref:Uncharacterized protein n=1 Tax=Citrus x changshan-huyou TaxID=2935761 RepID=A0AAP0QRY3_9ROSI